MSFWGASTIASARVRAEKLAMGGQYPDQAACASPSAFSMSSVSFSGLVVGA